MFHVKPLPSPDPALANPLSQEPVERLNLYATLLQTWTRRINLLAEGDTARIWQRHISDCAQLAPLLPQGEPRLIDLGSGAGFPGLVLGVITGWHVTLVEADLRKAAFLREALRETATKGQVVCERAERLKLPPAGVVTARALAPLATLLAWSAPLLLPKGCALFPKGETAEAELTQAGACWHMTVERFPSATSRAATILRLSEIRRVPGS
jgi:16S rRNA (guanine527-N7)-methyltransferase